MNKRIAALRGTDLAGLHAAGTVPDLSVLDGVMDGAVLTGSLTLPGLRNVGLWRGKVLEQTSHGPRGVNRLGVGSLELRRFHFAARVDTSHFGDREVVLLDHDNPANPDYVRRFHDELVQVDDGLFLATSHYRVADGLRELCYFALSTR